MLAAGVDPIRRISIIPPGQACHVLGAGRADRFNHERDELEAKIKVALGERCTEELVFGQPSTRAGRTCSS